MLESVWENPKNLIPINHLKCHHQWKTILKNVMIVSKV